jgi:hypothetical protein
MNNYELFLTVFASVYVLTSMVWGIDDGGYLGKMFLLLLNAAFWGFVTVMYVGV